MKNLLLIILMIMPFSTVLHAQWTTSGNNIYNSNSGNVGIGTANPATKFEVNNGNASQPFYFRVDPADPYIQLRLLNTTTTSNTAIFDIRAKRPTGQSSNGGASMLILGYDASQVLSETGANQSDFYLRNDDPLNSFFGYGSYNTARSISYDSRLLEINGNTGYQFARTNLSTGHVNHFRWEFDGIEKMRIISSGNVGIGTSLTSNPNNYKLAVKGKIGAQEVQVENTSTTWADYVFEKDYKLMSLGDVESFIKSNKHLPEVPSADEVKENGHKLGEMDVLLLKKVEEMTLYIIEQQKQIAIQSEKIAALEKKIDTSNKK